MQRLKKRGEVEAFDLGELTGFKVLDGSTIELKHCGHGLVSQWQKQLQRMKLAEVRRVSAMLAEYGEDALRELYQDAHDALEDARKAKAKALEDQGADVPEHLADPTPFRSAISTPEGFDDLVEAQKSAVRDCAARMVLDGEAIEDPAEIADEVERLGALASVYRRAMEVQRITAAEFPSVASAGDDGRGENCAVVA